MTTQLSKAQQKRVAKLADAVTDTLDELFSDDLHVKRIESLGNATIGLLGSAKAGVHAIGIGLAHVRGLRQKHTIKQVEGGLNSGCTSGGLNSGCTSPGVEPPLWRLPNPRRSTLRWHSSLMAPAARGGDTCRAPTTPLERVPGHSHHTGSTSSIHTALSSAASLVGQPCRINSF